MYKKVQENFVKRLEEGHRKSIAFSIWKTNKLMQFKEQFNFGILKNKS